MLEEVFRGYRLKARPYKKRMETWGVSVHVEHIKTQKSDIFTAHDGIYYILEMEAAKESINLGKNLIKGNLLGF